MQPFPEILSQNHIHAIIDWVCLEFPKQCIVGYSLTNPIGLVWPKSFSCLLRLCKILYLQHQKINCNCNAVKLPLLSAAGEESVYKTSSDGLALRLAPETGKKLKMESTAVHCNWACRQSLRFPCQWAPTSLAMTTATEPLYMRQCSHPHTASCLQRRWRCSVMCTYFIDAGVEPLPCSVLSPYCGLWNST